MPTRRSWKLKARFRPQTLNDGSISVKKSRVAPAQRGTIASVAIQHNFHLPRFTCFTHQRYTTRPVIPRRISLHSQRILHESRHRAAHLLSFRMAFPGGSGMMPGLAGRAGMTEQQMQEQQMIKTMQGVMESCAGKSVMSGVMGFALGGVFGLFMSSVCSQPTSLEVCFIILTFHDRCATTPPSA